MSVARPEPMTHETMPAGATLPGLFIEILDQILQVRSVGELTPLDLGAIGYDRTMDLSLEFVGLVGGGAGHHRLEATVIGVAFDRQWEEEHLESGIGNQVDFLS